MFFGFYHWHANAIQVSTIGRDSGTSDFFILPILHIHMIFSWTQIRRSAIFGREIGVPDREIFSRQKIFKFNVKNCLIASPYITVKCFISQRMVNWR